MDDRRYRCALCHEEFVSDRPDKAAREAFEETFGMPFDEEIIAVLCDDCFNRIIYGEKTQ